MYRYALMLAALPLPLLGDTLAIIHINDTHHHLFPYKSYNGIASAAYLIRNLRATYPNNLLFHAGDVFVGDFSFPYGLGREELKLLSLLGPDAITLGNHELDITPDSLYAVLSDVGGFTTFLSANLRPDTIPLASLVRPYTTFTRSGRLICVLGLTTNQFNLLSPAQQPVQFENPVYIAQIYEDTFDVLGCDYRIILSHAGVDADSAIASSTRSYDLIVSGHTHACYDEPAKIINTSGDTTYFAEACQHYEAVGLWLIDMGTLRPVSHALFRLDAGSPVDGEFVDSLSALRARIEARYGDVFSDFVAYTPRELRNVPDSARYLDTPLGNLIADAIRDKASADIGVVPYFYIAELPAGRITSNDVLLAFPYGLSETAQTGTNMRLLRATLRGADLYRLLSITQSFSDSTPIAQVSGMEYRFDPSQSPPLEVSDITVGGLPLDTNASYSLALDMGTLYLANLLGITPISVETTAYTMFSAMREYFSEMILLNPTSEGRIAYKSAVALAEYHDDVPSHVRVVDGAVISDEPFSAYDVSGRLIASGVRYLKVGGRRVIFVRTGGRVVKLLIR
ncbi:MAG: bifunctional metallophosphatase/5'-nucleotidase [Thermotogae bacterium]|nr:bifunctional metallophosphatase/5'-nucleotidase [Thermotogota bacterium]